MPDHVFTYFPPLARHSSFVLSKLLAARVVELLIMLFLEKEAFVYIPFRKSVPD